MEGRLLRGSDSQLLDKHWNAFLKEEKEVDTLAKGLQADLRIRSWPAGRRLRRPAHKMAAGYRDGLEKFKSAGLESSVGDMAVRGIDREAAKLLRELKAAIAQRSAEASQQAYADGRRAVAWSLGMMLLAAVLGVGIGMRISRDVVGPLQTAVAAADAVARGDLSHTVQVRGQDETGRLLGALATMQTQLRRLVQDVRGNAEQVASASAQIALGNSDLATRTEQQASSLQETASSMEELDGAVRHNAQSAQEASALASRQRRGPAGRHGRGRRGGHHEGHPGRLAPHRRHHRRDRRHRLPDQHPGPERRGGSRPRRGTGARLRGGGQRSAQPGRTLGRGGPRSSS
jgi:methyl-accepting chemotaxis protein-1 (serine sensor receptor)